MHRRPMFPRVAMASRLLRVLPIDHCAESCRVGGSAKQRHSLFDPAQRRDLVQGITSRRTFAAGLGAARGVGLLNVARAGLVDHQALVAALRGGMVSSAIIDVHDPETLPAESPLWHVPNLFLMPHVSSDDEDRYLPRTLDLVCENMRRLSAGEPLLHMGDPTREEWRGFRAI